jgi:hypothetical protein
LAIRRLPSWLTLALCCLQLSCAGECQLQRSREWDEVQAVQINRTVSDMAIYNFCKAHKVIGRIKLTSWANSSQLSAKDSSVFFSDSNSLKATCIAGSHRSPLGCSLRFSKYTACLRQKFSQASTVLDRCCNSCVVSLLTRTIQSRDFRAFSSWSLAALEEERSLDWNKG